MRVKILIPNADGSSAITMQEFDAVPQVGDVIVYQNGNAYTVDYSAPNPGDPDRCEVMLRVRTPKLPSAPASGFLQGRNVGF